MPAMKNDEKYNEFKVVGHIEKGTRNFIIDKKEQTDRGSVMITAKDAEVNNAQTRFNFLHYEKAKVEKNEKRIGLEKEAIELGVKFRDNIGDAKLLEKINEAKK